MYVVVTRDTWFDAGYRAVSDPAEAWAQGVAQALDTSAPSWTTPTSTSTSSTIQLSDEELYGFEESAEFDALCHQAVDEVESVVGSVRRVAGG